jgi:hypothetical protein
MAPKTCELFRLPGSPLTPTPIHQDTLQAQNVPRLWGLGMRTDRDNGLNGDPMIPVRAQRIFTGYASKLKRGGNRPYGRYGFGRCRGDGGIGHRGGWVGLTEEGPSGHL